VYCWIKEVKSGRKDLSDILPSGRVTDDRLNDCNGTVLKANLQLLTGNITQALDISSMKIPNHLTKSLGMKCHHARWVPHMLTATQRTNVKRWPEACYKRWKAMQPLTSTSCGCSMSNIMKQCGHCRGRK
jgi:hypothetical protein